MQSTPAHDFKLSLAIARGDPALKTILFKYFKTDKLSSPDRSELVSATCDAITWPIQEARALYDKDPQRLVGLISTSNVANALATWQPPGYDCIVVTEGLMEILFNASDDMGALITQAFPELFKSQLGRKLQEVPPLRGGFKTALGSFLYFGAISFFAGHECGHHLAGHDGYYLNGAHAEVDDDNLNHDRATKTTEQALEQEADKIGINICKNTLAKLLSKLWDIRTFSDADKRHYQRILAILLSSGTLMALVRIRPREIDWVDIANSTHPPAIARIILMSLELSAALKLHFNSLDRVSRQWIPIKCLEVAAGGTIKSGTKEDMIRQERLARGGEPAAIRAVGIRKALFDKSLEQYYVNLERSLNVVRPQLRPRTSKKL